MGFVAIRKSPYPWLGDVFTDVYRNYLCLTLWSRGIRKIAGNTFLCLPVRRENVYFTKFFVGLVLSSVLILFNMLGLVFVGFIMDFPEPVEWSSYFSYVGKQILMILAIASIHNWLSSLL